MKKAGIQVKGAMPLGVCEPLDAGLVHLLSQLVPD